MSHAAEIAGLLRAVGCTVWITGEGRKTRLPEGFADLVFTHPRLKAPACWEAKRDGEPITEAQLQFEHDFCNGHGLYGRGDLGAAKLWLQKRGLLK